MADGPANGCADIPAILAGQDALTTKHSCAGSLFFDSYERLAPKVAKVEVKTDEGKDDSGTAFFVKDGTHMVTNNHVVEHSRELKIVYNGKRYEALVEKVDDINDLAELKILGLDADSNRAQKVGDVKLDPNERVIAVGVPGTHGQDKFINPGVLIRSDRLYRILTDPSVQDPEADRIHDAYYSGDPVLKQQAQDRADSPRLIVNQGGRPGESGMPLTDGDGNLVGVVTSVNGNNATLAVPFTKVQDLINSPDNTYTTNYQVTTSFKMPNFSAALENTAGVGVEGAAVMGKGRFLPLAYAGVRAVNLAHEVSELTHSTDDSQKHDLEVNIGQDAAMVAGGVGATLLWNSSVGRYASLGVMGLSLASRFYTDSQEKHFVRTGVTRKDGDSHRPWED